MSRKLIAVDLDGTLLSSGNFTSDDIPKKNSDIINKINELDDLHFCIFTGRPYRDAINIYRRLNLNTPLVTFGGSLITYPDGDKIFEHRVDKEIIKEIIKTINDNCIINNYLLEFSEDGWSVKHGGTVEFLERYNLELDESTTYNIDHSLMILIDINITDNKSYTLSFLENIKAKYNDLNIIIWDNEENGFLELEITSGFGGKDNALINLCNKLDIDIKETYTFGDSLNDLPMNSISPNSYAVSNACNELKDCSTNTLDKSNNEGAVGHELEKLFL